MFLPPAAGAASFGSEKLLVVHRNVLSEYTPDGVLIQEIAVPYPGGRRVGENANGVTVTQDGRVAIYNGRFDPFLSIHDPRSGTWTHLTHPGWSGFGGVAYSAPFFFASDFRTFSEPADLAEGIVRFDEGSGEPIRFATQDSYVFVALGLDGMLYALPDRRTNEVDVFQPASMELIRTIELNGPGFDFPSSARALSIAVDANGDLFVVAQGTLFLADSDGTAIDSVFVGFTFGGLGDISIRPDGRIVIGTRLGAVFVTDRTLVSFTSFRVGGDNVSVAQVHPTPVILISIDIKPGSDTNPINPFAGKAAIPVAILGSDTFDVAEVDVTTLAFGPDGAAPAHPQGGHVSDVNEDGLTDLLSHYRTQETGIATGDTGACVTGETLDGIPFEGCDSINTQPPCGGGYVAALALPPLLWVGGRRRRKRA